MFEALVEHHRDVGSEARLDVHGGLRRQEVLAAVEMRPEGRALLVHFSARREAEYLIAAAVGQDRLVPADEFVKPAQSANALGAGTQIEMIGIREDDLGAEVLEIAMRDRLYGALRTRRA